MWWVVCAKEKDVHAGVGTGSVDASSGEEKNGSIECKDGVRVSGWNAIRKCKYEICPAATGHRIKIDMGNTMQSDGDMNAEVSKTAQCGWNNWRKMSGVICEQRMPPHVKGKRGPKQDDCSANYDVRQE